MRFFSMLILSIALLVSSSVSAAPLETQTSDQTTQAGVSADASGIPAGLADRDNDGLSDGLGARIEAAAAADPFDVIVTFAEPGRSAATARGIVGPFAVSQEFSSIRGFAATMTAAQIAGLADMPGLHRIEEDFAVTAMIDGATADFGSDAARIDFNVDGSGAAMGRPVGICVIDTGIADHHEQLNPGKVVAFFDSIYGLTSPYDDHGHGTHVASIAAGDGVGGLSAATYQGVAPRAALYGAKTLNGEGSGTASQIIAGIDWCVAQAGVDILSMSIGTARGSDGLDSLSQAANCAADPGWSSVCTNPGATPKIVVVGAGNAGPDNETVGAPGAAERAITVGAVANYSGDGRGVYLSAFSSRGPTLDGRPKPDISAPGVRIAAAGHIFPESYVVYSGTSMATPFVSGVVALMLDANPDLRLPDPATGQLPVDRVRDILAATAQDRGPDGPAGETRDYEYGRGLVDAYAAVAQADGLTVGQYDPTRMPKYVRTVATVPNSGEWFSDPFKVAGDGTPIAATITIEGSRACGFNSPNLCNLLGGGWVWDPDLDMQLIDAATGAAVPASGNDITLSECPLAGEWCGVGRQETVYYMPPGPGVYRLRVYAFDVAGGTFALEVSGLDIGLIANAGSDQVVYDNDASGLEGVTLDGSQSSHDDGTIVSYEWHEDATLLATGANATVGLGHGIHSITLTVTDEAGNAETDMVVAEVRANAPPVANAGADQTVSDDDGDGTATVLLDGSGSIDPVGGVISSYKWSEGGVEIGSGATAAVPLAIGTHDIVLTVTDNGGATASDTVTVTVTTNQAPVADAGPDQTVTDNDDDGAETVLLDGSASTDPGGAIVSYEWTQGATVVGTGPTLSLLLPVGNHNFSLTVADGSGITAEDSIAVSVLANQTPVADVGPDITLPDYDGGGTETFALDAGLSSDPGGGTIVSYEWSEGGAVIGSGAILPLARPIGSYSFTLTVTDEAGASATDSLTVTVTPDPYFANVVLLTHLDGPDGATYAVDESSRNHALTLLGNAQIDTAQSHFGGASALFDDTEASFVSVADSNDWHFGSGEFTVEAWVSFSTLDTYSVLMDQADFTANQVSWRLDWTATNYIRFLFSPDGTNASRMTLLAPWAPAANKWYHIAVDRDANQNLRVYVDGKILINSVVSTAFHDSTAGLRFGERHAGWMDDVRITKDLARYQGAFEKPNKPATFDDVVLLAHLDGSDGATAAVDDSNSRHALNFAGTAQIDTAQSRFGGAAALFDDTEATYVSLADSSDWHFGNSEFTVEAWVNFSTLDTYSVLMDQSDFTANQISWRLDWTASKYIRFLFSPDGTDASRVTLLAPWAPSANRWYHVAVDRDSNQNLRVYVDGNVLINVVEPAAFHDSDAPLRFGERHAGWLDEVRITKGAAQYAGAFDPPAPPPNFDNVVLLSSLDGVDGDTAAIDKSNGNHMIAFVGGTQIDTGQSRFGGASVLFDDTDASFLSVADSDDWHFGAGEFTIEGWVQFSSLASYSVLADHADFVTDEISWRLDWTSTNYLRFLYSPDGTNASRVTLAASWTPTPGAWHHIAVDRDSSGQLRIYADGSVVLSAPAPGGLHNSTAALRFGERHAGWIDEVRITKGIAQYGGSFIPPDEPFVDAGATVTASAY